MVQALKTSILARKKLKVLTWVFFISPLVVSLERSFPGKNWGERTKTPTDSASHLQVYYRHPSLGSKIYIERLPGMKHYTGIDLNVATKKILIPQRKRSTADEKRELQLIACTHHLQLFWLTHTCVLPKLQPNPHPHLNFFLF